MTRKKTDTDEQSTSNGVLRRRRFIEATGAGVATTGLAGCLPDGEDGTDGQTPDDTDNTPAGTQTDTGEDGEPSLDGPFKIGHLGPTSGPTAFVGRGSQRAGQIAVDELNENGGLLGAEVEFYHEDTEATPSTAQAAVQRLINQEDIDMLIGTYITEVTQSILAFVSEFEIPFIVTGSAAPSTVTDFIGQDYDQYKNFFRTGPPNSFYQAQAMADYAAYLNDRHGWTSFAMAPEDATWTRTFSNSMPDMLRAKGFDIPYNERISLSIGNWEPVRSDIDSSGADAVFRFFANLQGGEFLGEWHTFEPNFAVEGVHVAAMLPSFYQLSEGYAEYCTTSQSGAGGVAAITETTQPFVEKYRQRHEGGDPPSTQPMYMGFNTYDGIYFWKNVVEEAGTWNAEENLDDLVATALETSYTGTVGDIELYGPDAQYPHDVVVPGAGDENRINYPVTQWDTQGDVECVYPTEYATADHLAPNWM